MGDIDPHAKATSCLAHIRRTKRVVNRSQPLRERIKELFWKVKPHLVKDYLDDCDYDREVCSFAATIMTVGQSCLAETKTGGTCGSFAGIATALAGSSGQS